MTNKKDKYEMTDAERTEFYKELEEMRKSPRPGYFLMTDAIISENKGCLGEEFQMTAEEEKKANDILRNIKPDKYGTVHVAMNGIAVDGIMKFHKNKKK